MANKKITLAELEPTDVELLGHTYILKPITRKVQAALEAAQDKLDKIEQSEEQDSDSLVSAMCEMIAALLDGTPAVKKVLTDAWRGDTLSLPQLAALVNDLQEAGALAGRPT